MWLHSCTTEEDVHFDTDVLSLSQPQPFSLECWMYTFCVELQLLQTVLGWESSLSHINIAGFSSKHWYTGKETWCLASWLWVCFCTVSSQDVVCSPWNFIVSCQIWNATTSCLHLEPVKQCCSLKKLCVHVKYTHIYIHYTSMCMKCISSYFLIQCIHLLIFNYIWYKLKVCCKNLYLTVLREREKERERERERKIQSCNRNGTTLKISPLTSLLPEKYLQTKLWILLLFLQWLFV